MKGRHLDGELWDKKSSALGLDRINSIDAVHS